MLKKAIMTKDLGDKCKTYSVRRIYITATYFYPASENDVGLM